MNEEEPANDSLGKLHERRVRIVRYVQRKSRKVNVIGRPIYGVLLGLILLCVSGCSQQADEATCDRVYDHMVKLKSLGEPAIVKKVNADKAEAERFPFLEACVGKFSLRMTQCLLASSGLVAFKKCNHE